jgi:hypothetical protein
MVMFMAFSACSVFGPDDSPPTLLGYEIVDGVASCQGCGLSGPRVTPDADAVLVLRLDRVYTARSRVRTAGNPDHCIYKVVGYSWWLSNHEFWCSGPERKDMVIDDAIDTRAFFVERTANHRVTVWLQEYDISTRSGLFSQQLYSFPVRFVSP